MVSLPSSWRPSGAGTDKAAISNSSATDSRGDTSLCAVSSLCRPARISPDLSRMPCPSGTSSSCSSDVDSPSQQKHTAAAVVASTAGSSLPSRRLLFHCAGVVLCFCVYLCACPSVFGDRLAPVFTDFSSRMVDFREIFHFYCLRPTGGADAARALTSPILVLSALYLPCVFLLQRYMRSRRAFRLKWACVAWNFLLSILSCMGFVAMLVSQPSLVLRPVLPELEFTPPVRAVICIFTLSKAVEYGDTLLLVLRKKPLIFLHVYHHLTVTLYCWHAQLVRVSVGHYFAFLNLVIHSWMYLYYALAALFPSHPLLRSWRPLITVSQILQMCVGLTLASYALSQGLVPDEQFNATLAVGMYISYAVLFVQFFFNAYVPRTRKSRSASLATPLQLLILIHLLAAAGLYLLLTHSRRSTLLLEILSFSAATAAVLPFVLRTHHRKCSSSSKAFGGSYRCCMPPLTADDPLPQACSSTSFKNADSMTSSSSRICCNAVSFGVHSSDSIKFSGHAALNQIALQPGSTALKEEPFQSSSSSGVQRAPAGAIAAAVEDCASRRGKDIMPVLPQEHSRGVDSNCSVKPQLLQISEEQLQQQSAADSTPAYGARKTPFILNGIDVCHGDWCAAAVKASAAAQAITPSSGDAEAKQQQGMWKGSSAVAAASLVPADMRQRPQDSSGDSGSTSNSAGSTDSFRQFRGAAAAVLQEMPRTSSQQEEQQPGEYPDSDKAISRIINSDSVSFSRSSYSSNCKPCGRSSGSINTEVRSIRTPAAVADREQKSNFVAAAHAALQSGGQTLLTISNFLLACALKRLMDVQEAAAAAATAGRTAGDMRSSKADVAEEVLALVAARSCTRAGSRDATGIVAGQEKTTEQRASTEKNSRSIDTAASQREIRKGKQQQQVDEKEMEIKRVCELSQQSCCNNGAEQQLVEQQQQQQTGSAAAGKPAGKQQQKDSSTDFFCEENSSTVCSSPDNLACGDLYNSAAAAGRSVVGAAAAETDSPGVQTAPSSRAAEEMSSPPPPQSFCSAYHSLSIVERATPETRSKSCRSENQLRVRGEEEKELLLRDMDSIAQPSPVSTRDVSGTPAVAVLETGETAFGVLLQEQRRLKEQLQQENTQQQQISVDSSSGNGSSSTTLQRSSGFVLRCTDHTDIKQTTAARMTEVLLVATCAGLPAFYGWLMHGNALLGLCVHGALRWLLELYTSRTFYSSRRRIFVAAGGAAAAGDRSLKQQQQRA